MDWLDYHYYNAHNAFRVTGKFHYTSPAQLSLSKYMFILESIDIILSVF